MSSPQPTTTPLPAVPQLPPPAPAVPQPPKNPWIALILSFLFPGIGQIYNGQIAKAIFFASAFIGCIFLTASDQGPLPFALFIPFTIFANLVDAYRSATLINARWAGRGVYVEEDNAEGPGWGISLVVIGLVLLFNNLGWLSLAGLARYWPVLLIGAGVAFLWKSVQKPPAGPGDAPNL
jgi:TM2 domain-containing membrane protein YozV